MGWRELAQQALSRPRFAETEPVPMAPTAPIAPPAGAIGAIGTNGTGPDTGAPSPAAGDLAERSAIIEEGAGVPREWADAFARVQDGPPPPNVAAREWIATVGGVGRFLDGWAVRAHALGWKPAELFGMGTGLRQDRKGAAWLIGGAQVVAVTAEAITLRANTGALSRIYRSTRASVGPAWGTHP